MNVFRTTDVMEPGEEILLKNSNKSEVTSVRKSKSKKNL